MNGCGDQIVGFDAAFLDYRKTQESREFLDFRQLQDDVRRGVITLPFVIRENR